MLSLVNYGSSGESDDEDNTENISNDTGEQAKSPTNSSNDPEDAKFNDEEWKGSQVQSADIASKSNLASKPSPGVKISDLKDSRDGEDLLSKLPPPVSDLRSIPWDQLSKLTYKSRAIRIMAPEIPEDVEEKKEKKMPSKTGSGLLAMLPKPKNEFVAQPKQLKLATGSSKKFVPTAAKPKVIPKPKLAATKSTVEDHASDSDGEAEENVDFFSLSAPEAPEVNDTNKSRETVVPPLNEIPMPSDPTEKIVAPPTEPAPFYIDTSSEPSRQNQSSAYDYVQFQEPNDQLELDNEALAALCGSRGLKRKASKDELRMIDINGSQLTPDAQELLTKNLTGEQPRPQKNNRDGGPTSQQKRKHQIIYLAHQAKEQELELQNTWANNRMSKKQTQAKYGF